MTPKDTLIVMVGGNDFVRSEGHKAVKNLYKGLKSTANTSVYEVGVPHRHDLTDYSCVNREVKSTNNKLTKVCKSYPNVKFVYLELLIKSNLIRHGLHLNNITKVSRWRTCKTHQVTVLWLSQCHTSNVQ